MMGFNLSSGRLRKNPPPASPPTPAPRTVRPRSADTWRRGVGGLGGGGSFAPPTPQEFPPLPLHESLGHEPTRAQGEALTGCSRESAGTMSARVRGGRWMAVAVFSA